MGTKKLQPDLRFPEFVSEWHPTKLGDVSSRVAYGMNAAAKPFDGSNKYVRITDINEESRQFSLSDLTSPEGAIEDKYKLREGDIVFARTGASVGKAYLYRTDDGNVLFAGFLIRFSITKADPYFVFCQTFRHEYWKWVMATSMRSGQPGLNAEEYKGYEFFLPESREQQKIAAFLSAVDRRIEQLNQRLALLEKYKKGVMQQIFSRQIRFRDEKGNAYPDWDERRIGNILKIGSGKDYKHLKSGNVPVYGTGGVLSFVGDCLFDGESVCIGRKGTIDKPLLLKGKFWTVDTLFYTHSFVSCVPKFVYYLFLTINWKLYNEASGVPSLSKNTIEGIKIHLPSLEEQTKIANFLSAIDTKIEVVKKQVENTRQFKKGLLQKMFV